MKPLLSIVIPTRNRPELAQLSVEQALSSGGDDCEVVVADNGDRPLDLEIDDRRLHVLPPTDRVLSMTDNWERALDAAKGEWLVLLADKFVLVPGALDVLKRLSTRADVVCYGMGVFRQSLSAEEVSDRDIVLGHHGTLTSPKPPYNAEMRNSSEALERLYREVEYPKHLPMLYSALVRRSVVEAARSVGGRFFVGSSPDVASAAQLLSASKFYLETNAPAILIHYPNTALRWSNGMACTQSSADAEIFLAESGMSSGSSRALPPLVMASIFQTLMDAAKLNPQLPAIGSRSWKAFVKQASREIEGRAFRERARLHRDLFASYQKSQPWIQLAWLQARAGIACHLPRWAAATWRETRGITLDSDGGGAREVVQTPVARRDEALSMLSEAIGSLGGW